MALPANYDYTVKDFDSIDDRLKSLITSVFPEWPIDAEANPGNLLRQLQAYTGDILTYYQDNQSKELFWSELRQRVSAIRKGKLINYELSGASAATADVTVTISNGPLADNLTIAAGSIVRTSQIVNPIKGETQAAVQILAGNTTGTLSWEHSETKSATFSSSGKADQEFFIDETPYIDNSMVVTTSLGTWTEVDNFLDSEANDLHYTVAVDQNDKPTIKTGDGTNGKIPDGTINVSLTVGGGTDGNVAVNSLTVIEGTFADDSGNPAVLTVTNAAAASGGADRETVAAAKVNAPASLRVLGSRSVAREDFEIVALRVPGVARALMVTSNEVSMAENRGRLYIVPDGGGTASAALLAAVTTQFDTYKPTVTFQLEVVTASYLTVDVVCHAWARQGVTNATMKANIELALAELFEPTVSRQRTADGTLLLVGAANPFVDFGWNFKDADGNPAGEIAWSDVHNAARDATGVRKVGSGATEFTINGVRDDLTLANYQFPMLGTVSVFDGSTGLQI